MGSGSSDNRLRGGVVVTPLCTLAGETCQSSIDARYTGNDVVLQFTYTHTWHAFAACR